jgi:hypothetical protein
MLVAGGITKSECRQIRLRKEMTIPLYKVVIGEKVSMQNSPYQGGPYVPCGNYYYLPIKVLTLLVVPMEAGSAPYSINLQTKGKEVGASFFPRQ